MVPSCDEGINGWTLPTLVGAFVDLAVAYLLLLAAATTFLSSRILSVLGLRLPCTCSHPASGAWCLRSLLFNGPHSCIASVHRSLSRRAPFHDCPSCPRTHPDRGKLGFFLGGARSLPPTVDESCGSVKRARLLIKGGCDGSSSESSQEGGSSLRVPRKGSRLRRRRACGLGRMRSLAFNRTPLLGWQEEGNGGDASPCDNAAWLGMATSEGSQTPTSFQGYCASEGVEKFSHCSSSHLVEKNILCGELSGGDSKLNAIKEEILKDPHRRSEETVKMLSKVLEEEQLARAALHLELEKERTASASAADEAMAMIERLQHEKASIDMNARQFQRMIEEKAEYDEEEMEILKEIIVKRERELFVMGKEVELYRQLILSGVMERLEESIGHPETIEFSKQVRNTSKEQGQDSLMTLPHVPWSLKMEEEAKDDHGSTSNDPAMIDNESSSYDNGEKLLSFDVAKQSILQAIQISEHSTKRASHTEVDVCVKDEHLDFQEKGIVSVDDYISQIRSQNQGVVDTLNSCTTDVNRDHGIPLETSIVVKTREKNCKIENSLSCIHSFEKNDIEGSIRCVDSCISDTETEPSAFDVHVIDHKNTNNRGENARDEVPVLNGYSAMTQDCCFPFMPEVKSIKILSHHSGTSLIAEEPEGKSSCSDASRATALSRLASSLDLRSPIPEIVDERCKLEIEVEDLRRKLKTIQQDRRKLNLSAEVTDQENLHTKLLGEIALQLREMKESLKASKKKQRRSMSCGRKEST